MTMSEFLRRTALGKKAEVRIETQIIIELMNCISATKRLHAALLERGVKPPEEEWLLIIQNANAATYRIGK
jgi:predicted RNA-binding protein